MCIKAMLLLAVILAARSGCFGGSDGDCDGSSRRTLALACDQTMAESESEAAAAAVAATAAGMGLGTYKNNRYSKNSNNNNNNNNKEYNDYNYNYADVDGIADSNNNGNNNDNYNYNNALAKWQEEQEQEQEQEQPQILYGNPSQNIYDYSTNSKLQQQQQQQHLQQQQLQQQQKQQRQFDDDPENASNDFRLQLSDLNAAIQGVVLGMGMSRSMFAGQEQIQDNANDNNVEQELELSMEHRSRREPGQLEYYVDDDDAAAAAKLAPADDTTVDDIGIGIGNARPADTASDSIDFEGEEEYAVQRVGQKEDADELSSQLPYGIQNVRKRRVRSVMPPTQQFNLNPITNPNNNDGVTYQSLCPTNRVTIKLDMGEYRPNHYVEVTCAHNYAPQPTSMPNYDYNYRSNELPLLRALLSERGGEKREICSATGFACIQLNRTIHLIRLNEESGCWESETRTVPSGCECMWPKHSYGDIAFYHQKQKRFGGTLLRRTGAGASAGLGGGSGAGIDYKPGVGYRQLKLKSRNRRENFNPYESYDFN